MDLFQFSGNLEGEHRDVQDTILESFKMLD